MDESIFIKVKALKRLPEHNTFQNWICDGRPVSGWYNENDNTINNQCYKVHIGDYTYWLEEKSFWEIKDFYIEELEKRGFKVI